MKKNWRLWYKIIIICSRDIVMKFWRRKMCVAHNEKWKKPNNERNRTATSRKNQNARRKGRLQVVWNIGSENLKQVEMKIRKEYLRWTRKLLQTKICRRNLIKGINTWDVSLVRCLGPFLKRTREEFKQIDQRKRKLTTMLVYVIREMT